MNIKALVIRAAQHAGQLAQTIFGIRALPVSSAASAINADRQTPQAPASKRRWRNRTRNEVEVLPLEQRRWLTIKETSARFPCFSEKALRHLVAQAEAYANYPKAGLRSNGFIGCIVRPAGQRKVIIDATKFEVWLASSAVAGSGVKLPRSREQTARGSS